MQVGVLVQNFGGFPDTRRGAGACVDLAVQAERLGFASVWVTDHIVIPRTIEAVYPHGPSGFPYRHDQAIYEPLTLMAALAQATSRVEIGVAVLVMPYRHPLVTAKMLATIDDLAGGRVILGAGVGWMRDEFRALGLPDAIFEHRGSVTEETLRALRAAFESDGPASFTGRYSAFTDVGTLPQPQRHLPFWIGGKGDQALRRAVRVGDGYLAIGSDPTLLGAEVARLRELAQAAGRRDGDLTIAAIDGIALTDRAIDVRRSPLHGSTEQVLEGLRSFAAAGLQHLVAGVRRADDPSYAGTLDALGRVGREIVPELARLDH